MKRGQLLMTCCATALLAACWGGGGSDGGSHFSQPATHPLNDTGITLCGDYAYAPGSGTHNNNVNCAVAAATQTVDGTDGDGDPVPAGQDAVYGRDVDDDTNADGQQGFSFTKLGANGVDLVIQNGVWSDGGIENNGTLWSCVRDEVTGLVWEVKTNDNGLRDKDWTYTWYDSNVATNGGSAGTPDTGVLAASDNCYVESRCDTEKYVADVNGMSLCGASDWRLPTRDELKTLRHLGVAAPTIEPSYFPNTLAANFWTATPNAASSSNAWITDFADGSEQSLGKSLPYTVRLVRDAD